MVLLEEKINKSPTAKKSLSVAKKSPAANESSLSAANKSPSAAKKSPAANESPAVKRSINDDNSNNNKKETNKKRRATPITTPPRFRLEYDKELLDARISDTSSDQEQESINRDEVDIQSKDDDDDNVDMDNFLQGDREQIKLYYILYDNPIVI